MSEAIKKTIEALEWLADAPAALAEAGEAVAVLTAERDAAIARASALEEALARSQKAATALSDIIAQVREDAADGVLDNPVPDVN